MRKFIYFLLIISVSLEGFTEPAPLWKKTQEKQGILTFQKDDGSNILQVKGITVVDARIDIVGSIFRDIPMHNRWVGYCEEARILKIIDPQHYIFYEILSPPWPVSKRDLVINSVSTYNDDAIKVSIESNTMPENFFPLSEKYVRMNELKAKIDFEYISETKTGVSYELKINPDGDIPPFIINIFNEIYIYDNMANLGKITRDKSYTGTLSKNEDSILFEKLSARPNIIKNTLKDRLARYIKSKQNLQFLINDSTFFSYWKENKNGFAEILFLGEHDADFKKKALEAIIKLYLERYSLTEPDLNTLVQNPRLQKIFINESIEKGLTLELVNQFKTL